MIRAGDMRTLFTVQQPNIVQSATGAPKEDWQDAGTMWGQLVPVTGREVMVAKSFSATANHRINARYRTDIKPNTRLLHGDRTFSVNAAYDPDQRKLELLIYATEVV